MKTYSAKPSDVERRWLLVDAAGMNLGRLATHVATVLRGTVEFERCRFSGVTEDELSQGAGLALQGNVQGSVRDCLMHGNGYGIRVPGD